jgi:hypothetical protein
LVTKFLQRYVQHFPAAGEVVIANDARCELAAGELPRARSEHPSHQSQGDAGLFPVCRAGDDTCTAFRLGLDVVREILEKLFEPSIGLRGLGLLIRCPLQVGVWRESREYTHHVVAYRSVPFSPYGLDARRGESG